MLFAVLTASTFQNEKDIMAPTKYQNYQQRVKHISLKPSPFLICSIESIIFNYFWILEQKLKFRRRISCNTLFQTESLFAVKRKGNLLSVNHLITPQHFAISHLFTSKLPVWLNLSKTKQRCLSTKLFALHVLAQRFLQH